MGSSLFGLVRESRGVVKPPLQIPPAARPRVEAIPIWICFRPGEVSTEINVLREKSAEETPRRGRDAPAARRARLSRCREATERCHRRPLSCSRTRYLSPGTRHHRLAGQIRHQSLAKAGIVRGSHPPTCTPHLHPYTVERTGQSRACRPAQPCRRPLHRPPVPLTLPVCRQTGWSRARKGNRANRVVRRHRGHAGSQHLGTGEQRNR